MTAKFRFGLAIGSQARSLVSKAVQSTKKSNEEDTTLLTESYEPTLSQVKISVAQLMDTIKKFKHDHINVLIATSVIEEGLDISTCNVVISINEIMNVKTFIQTKGRARQKNS